MKNFFSNGFLILGCFLLIATSSAQFSVNEMRPKKSDVEMVKSARIVVVLLEENEKYVEKMKKKGSSVELEKYFNLLKDFNEKISLLVPENFSFITSVEYKTMEEVKNMLVSERQKLNFLVYNIGASIKINATGPGVEAVVPKYNFYDKIVYSPLEKRSFNFEDRDASYGKMEIYSYDKKNKNGRIVFFKTLPHIIPSPGDVAYWLKRANYIFETVSKEGESSAGKKKVADNAHYLKEKTLLICKEDLHKNTNEESISKSYPYPFKIVSQEELDKAILSKDASSCVLIVFPVESPIPIFTQEIMDVSSCLIVTLGISGGMVAGIGGSAYKEVKDEHLKKYGQTVE